MSTNPNAAANGTTLSAATAAHQCHADPPGPMDPALLRTNTFGSWTKALSDQPQQVQRRRLEAVPHSACNQCNITTRIPRSCPPALSNPCRVQFLAFNPCRSVSSNEATSSGATLARCIQWQGEQCGIERRRRARQESQSSQVHQLTDACAEWGTSL